MTHIGQAAPTGQVAHKLSTAADHGRPQGKLRGRVRAEVFNRWSDQESAFDTTATALAAARRHCHLFQCVDIEAEAIHVRHKNHDTELRTITGAEPFVLRLHDEIAPSTFEAWVTREDGCLQLDLALPVHVLSGPRHLLQGLADAEITTMAHRYVTNTVATWATSRRRK